VKKDKIKDLSTKEILCKQLELLAECSKDCENHELPAITTAMVNIAAIIDKQTL